jgi:DNA-directed RNA polymerase subunit RPC12/RpoP
MNGEVATGSTHELECPHCGKAFEAELMAGGVERHRGYKCPHCKLFVPESRAEDAPLSRSDD